MNKRLLWADRARILAAFLVVAVHVNGVSFLGSVARIGVPLFVMLSGALVLNKKYDNEIKFLASHWMRILVPWVVWAGIYSVVQHGNWLMAVRSQFNFLKIMMFVYAVSPVLRRFGRKVWFWVAMAGIIKAVAKPVGIMDYPFDVVYLGYFALGGWIASQKETKIWKGIVMWITGLVVVSVGLEYTYTSLGVVVMALGAFLTLKSWGGTGSGLKAWAETGFGVYLMNILIVARWTWGDGLAKTIAVYILCASITWVLLRIRGVQLVVGG
jgi:surface polysaccharide O-acyltransferase-like enzyme